MGDHMQSEKWYAGLDDGIRFPVRVLHARGIETGQSCEGGDGHAYDRPTIDLLGNTPGAGFEALAALAQYGLRVRDVALLWSVDQALPGECFWRLTLWQPWPERADETPIFVWSYAAQSPATSPRDIPPEPDPNCPSCHGHGHATVRAGGITYASGVCRCVGGNVWAEESSPASRQEDA